MKFTPFKKPKRKISKLPNCEYPYLDDGGLHSPNGNAVCFECKFVTRFKMNRGELPICPHCNKKMLSIFCKIEVPRKTNNRGWVLLKRKCRIDIDKK